MNGNIFVDDEPDHPSAASGDFELRNRTGSRFFFSSPSSLPLPLDQVWTRQI